jgi:hypothetical protein
MKKEMSGYSQFNLTPASTACGVKLTTAIPNPPAIKAPIIARNLRIIVVTSRSV